MLLLLIHLTFRTRSQLALDNLVNLKVKTADLLMDNSVKLIQFCQHALVQKEMKQEKTADQTVNNSASQSIHCLTALVQVENNQQLTVIITKFTDQKIQLQRRLPQHQDQRQLDHTSTCQDAMENTTIIQETHVLLQLLSEPKKEHFQSAKEHLLRDHQ